MSYRDVSESLRAYRDRVARDLDEARLAAREATERARKVTVLERELTETDGLLQKLGGRRRGLPMLDELQIAAPCTASWDAMVGDDHVRFCGQCEKNVYNLSSLPREEAEALLVAREGSLCVRMYKRQDGTVLTADCPVGVKKRRRRRATVAAVGGGLMAAAAALGMERSAPLMGSAPMATMGEPAIMGSAVPVQGGIGPGPVVDPPPVPQQKVDPGWTAGKPVMGRPPPHPQTGAIMGRR
jgi:hypothetical protein